MPPAFKCEHMLLFMIQSIIFVSTGFYIIVDKVSLGFGLLLRQKKILFFFFLQFS